MPKIIEVEFSPNGILGRVTGPETITYPGVFLGLPFDVHMPRGVAVFGPDVKPETIIDVIMPPGTHIIGSGRVQTGSAETAIIKATLPESAPATENAAMHPVAGASTLPGHPARYPTLLCACPVDCDCPHCYVLYDQSGGVN